MFPLPSQKLRKFQEEAEVEIVEQAVFQEEEIPKTQ